MAAVVVALTGVWLGAFAQASARDFGYNEYPVDFAGATWVSTAAVAPRVYFRLSVTLPVVPSSATLWLDADQGYAVSVNRVAVGSDAKAARKGAQVTAHPIDLSRQLTAGTNVVALQVTNWDGRTAAIRARLTVVYGTGSTDYLTGTAPWLATSDVTQVNHRLADGSPRYTSVGFDAGSWPPARRIPPVRGDVASTIPQAVMDAPLDADVLAGPKQSSDITASVALDLPDDPTDAWFRIIAPGNYVLLLDGTVLTTRSATPPVAANIYNLASFLHRGHNVLAVHVMASPIATVYAEGSVELPDHPSIVVATGHDWGVADAPDDSAVQQPPPTGGTDLGLPSVVFPTGIDKTVFTVSQLKTLTEDGVAVRVGTVVGLLLVWLLAAAAVALTAAVAFGPALCIEAAAMVPGAATIAMLELVDRFAPAGSPFPFVPLVVAVVVLLLVIPPAVVGALLARRAGVLAATPDGDNPSDARDGFGASETPEVPDTAAADPPSDAPDEDRPAALNGRLLRLRLRLETARRWVWSRPAEVAITAIAAICGVLTAYQLGYEPYWQDEIASLNAALGMRAHIIPELPSGFVYWKGELYSALIAVAGAVFGDQPSTLRLITVLWYVATVLAFGLFLLPLILGPSRRVLQVATTFVFATAPVELTWARDVRMYQQAQFFAVVFIGLFLLALRTNRTRYIVASAVTLVVMYLSHEETFVFLPAIPVVFLSAMRLRWIHDRRWWLLGGGAFAVIAAQYVLATFTHPPVFGYDHSNKPYILYDAHNFFYYFRQVYFAVETTGPTLMVISSLGVLASVVGAVRRSFDRLYLTALLWIPVLALSTIFSPKISRYVFVTLPVVFILGALGAGDFLDFLIAQLTPLKATVRQAGLVRWVVTAAVLPGFIWVFTSVSGGVSSYGLAVARLSGSPTARTEVDYDYAIAKVAPQIRPGDTIVTLCPPDIAAYYLKRNPDFIISTGRDKLLYLFERDGTVVDTTYGAPQILSARDLQDVIDDHHRIWVITDQGPYFDGVNAQITQLILTDFDEVSEGYGATVYFRGE